ncbi:unnamed protein product [Ectocarpus sp. 12 AP-2014]
MTAVTAVTANTASNTATSASPCTPDSTMAATPAPGVAGGGRGGGGCERKNRRCSSSSSNDDKSSCSGVRGSSEAGKRQREDKAPPADAWRSPSASASTPVTAPRAGAALSQATAAGWREDRSRSSAPPSWLDAGVFLRGVSALHLRGGVRAMSAAAAPSGGGGEEAGEGGKKKVDGEGRGKRVPLAGRPLFTSVASTKGHRPRMEDEFFLSSDGSFSAVYDGHGGANVSEYLRRNLYKHVMDHLPPGDDVYRLETVQEALRSAFKCADDYVITQTPYGNEGSCAVSVTIHCDREGKVSIISCNLGDSRAVLSRGGKALDLTEDHKPNAPKEMERIYRHHGMVTWEGFECSRGLQIEGTGVYRINGSLAVARAIGDIDYRPWLSAEVEIKTIDLKRETDQFVILASDGLWDVMSSEEAVQYVHAVMGGAMGSGKEGDKWSGGGGDKAGSSGAEADKPPHMTLVNWTQSYAEDRGMIRAATMLRKKKMAGYLTEEALRRGSTDNTTVAIVWLQ